MPTGQLCSGEVRRRVMTERSTNVSLTIAGPPSISVLGTPLLVTDYEGLGRACCDWTRAATPVVVEFANTQVAVMRRHETLFREFTRSYDAVAPDGMPLIWCLNRAGAGLRDRVYGPTFMRKFLDTVPSHHTHYLVGGSAECGQRLRERFGRSNPGIRFVGSFHGRCDVDGGLERDEETALLEEINRLSPDFIWVGFGTPKQQAWVHRYKSRLRRGVVLTVGFGFDVNAGLKPDQPMWMQRLGLGWLFRLLSEPRRLLGRYFKYNALFLWYLVWDGLRGKAITNAEGRVKNAERERPGARPQ
jgi:N-acetylglucosaminyldiphosphoundecaprenol N-acetyl-beta-D-mannosaminyltransferase